MEQHEGKNFNIISPTAKYVLLFKGNTDLPYARQVAELVSLPEKYEPDFGRRDFMWWAMVLHFENRYKSINQLLAGQPVHNVLELSSGYSFRGLTMVQTSDVHYIDTDLPDMMATKNELIKALSKPEQPAKGKLELLPLNVVDAEQFAAVVSHFEPGEIAIVNEGLLMYLDIEEKRKLCRNIRHTLQERGGCWITADIYIKQEREMRNNLADKDTQQIFKDMHVNDNMFDSFESAEAFFKSEGFVIDKEAIPEYDKSPALQYLKESVPPDELENISKMGKIQTAWRLKLA